jgi:uncharacterized protein
MALFAALLCGLVFGLGLLISGMADPAKVLGFLDLAGAWDPSLALVMAGAVTVGLIGFALARRRQTAWLGGAMTWPQATQIDRRLVGGGLLFGIGWGLAGICPGPALVALGAGYGAAAVFVVAMLVGMGLFEWLERRGRQAPAESPT